MADQRITYVALVAALRSEFDALALESLWIQMREHRDNRTSLGTLAQAVHDAHDIHYEEVGLTDLLEQAIGDPGSILVRGKGESSTRWSTRAVEAVLTRRTAHSGCGLKTWDAPDLEPGEFVCTCGRPFDEDDAQAPGGAA